MRLPAHDALDPELDARLVERCRAGDARAWVQLVSRYERLVYAVARGYRLDPDDVADVFQEVFAALVKGLPRMRDARALCRWLASTTDRIALATALRRRREAARAPSPAGERIDPRDPGPDAGTELETVEQQLMVRLGLAGLGERCRKLLDALYYRDPAPGYGEISKELGLPIGSIGPTRARCLDKLRRGLESLDPTPGGISREASPTSSPEPGGRDRGTPPARHPAQAPPRTEGPPHVP